MTSSQHVYEVRPRKDKRGVDLISDLLRYDEAGNVIETHGHTGEFKEWRVDSKSGGRLVPNLRQIQPAVEKEEAAACDDLFNFRSVAWRPAVVLA